MRAHPEGGPDRSPYLSIGRCLTAELGATGHGSNPGRHSPERSKVLRTSQRYISIAAALSLNAGCASSPAPVNDNPPSEIGNSKKVEIYALSDFHGWLLPRKTRSNPRFFGGIANIGGFLKHRHGATGDSAIIVDNGDMWTGPVESTVLKGEPVVAAYNEMGFAAANVANHEFDFGLDVLKARADEARFPFLGANIVVSDTGKAPDFVKPWTIVERNEVKVGIIGLSFKDTPKATMAKNVEGLRFEGYLETLKRAVPEVRSAGAKVVVLLLHDVSTEGESLVRSLSEDISVDLVVAGQDHRQSKSVVGDVPVVNPGPFGASYARFVVHYDSALGSVTSVDADIFYVSGPVDAPPYPADPSLNAIAQNAKERTVSLSGVEVGTLNEPLAVGSFASSPMGHFIVDAWLEALSEQAELAMVNHGGIRQPLPAGPVSLGDITSVMPFENNIYIVELSGSEIVSQLAIDHPVVGGLTWTYRETPAGREVLKVLDGRGFALNPDTTYRVAILDFMYNGGDGYEFARLDKSPVDTGLSWREPVIRAFRRSSAEARQIIPYPAARAKQLP